jgi:hypothetical protein
MSTDADCRKGLYHLLMKLNFSRRPGRWERHLKRRHGNALFSAEAQHVSHEAVREARRRDEQELQRFSEDFQSLAREVMALPAQAESEGVLKLKERIDRLYEESAGLAGDLSYEKQALRRLIAAIMRAIWAQIGSDPLAHSELEQEEAARAMHYQMLDHVLVADLLHPSSPIPQEDLVPALLSEEKIGLRAALALFDDSQRRELAAAARVLLMERQAHGLDLHQAWARLAVVESSLQSDQPTGRLM